MVAISPGDVERHAPAALHNEHDEVPQKTTTRKTTPQKTTTQKTTTQKTTTQNTTTQKTTPKTLRL